MRKTILLAGMFVLLSSCNSRSAFEQLVKVDSLVQAENIDFAHRELMVIDESTISNDNDRAHYNLLMSQIAYRIGKPLASDSLLDDAIDYYEHHVDNEKLADAYYYKAIGYNSKNEYQRSIILYKKAEQLAELTNNLHLQFKIAEAITYINGRSAQYTLQLQYAKKSLYLAQKVNNKNWIAYSLYRMDKAYSDLGMVDSARLYLNQIPHYLRSVDKKELPILLSSVGNLLRDDHPQEAKQYLLESLSYQELTATYSYLAEISYNEGNLEEACYYWKKGLKVNDASPKDNIIRNLIEFDIERGMTDSISDKVTEIIAIRDSIESKLKNDTIKDLQISFDHEVAMREKDQTIIHWQWGILVLIIIIVLLTGYIFRKKHMAALKEKDYQMEIQDKLYQIHELELNGEEDQQKLQELSDEIEKIYQEEAPRLHKGCILYNNLLENKPIVRWSADDEKVFVSYYTATHYRLVRKLKREPRRKELTTHGLVYLLLLEMGKSDKDICTIMGLTDSGLRGLRFRTKPLKEII